MYDIANVPAVRRALNVLADRPWHQFRWRSISEAKIDWRESAHGEGLVIPGDSSQQSKTDDPDWRRNWNWVVCDLQRTTSSSKKSYLLVHTTAGYWQTMFPVQTSRIALRVEPDDMVLYHCVGLSSIGGSVTPVFPGPLQRTSRLPTRDKVRDSFPEASCH